MKRKGFTLVELLAVIVILAVILIIAVPKISETIKNSKKAAFESSARTIANQAEKKKMENDSLGIDSNITCNDVAKLSESDYSSCNITFKDDTAYVTIYGSGKFEGLVIYDATKDNAVAVSSVATDISYFKYSEVDGGISIDAFLMGSTGKVVVEDADKCKAYLTDSFEIPENYATTYCNVEADEDGPTIQGAVDEGAIPSSDYETAGIKVEYYLIENVVVEDVDKCKTYLTDSLKIYENYATTFCNGEADEDGWTIQDLLNYGPYSIDDFKTAGISATTISFDRITDVVIPEKIDGKKVIRIGSNTFFRHNLTSIVIPNTVTTIGDYAFFSNKLTSVEIPSSVTTIGEAAFERNALTSVTIPSNVTTIGKKAFYGNNLTSVEIPLGVTIIGDYSFAWNSLKSVTIPSSVTTIGKQAFYGNYLTSVEIPLGVTIIGDYSFASNSLKSVTIPSSVTTIGEAAFGRNALTSVTIPSGVTTIGSSAFASNSLTSVEIPSSVTTIGESAFYVSSSSNNNLSTIVNNTGRSFDWGLIINGTSSTDYTFETGTVASTRISGWNVEITK